jgi:uncharacterized protein Yka (UPF0111/DUF47 family)
VREWLEWLAAQKERPFLAESLAKITSGDRAAGDSLHILVMDLHKALNGLSLELGSETVDGAHVWGLADDDRPRVRAFMRGVNRTSPLRFDHPGLDTAATRNGERLVIQNDIGTNDAHVLVLNVDALRIAVTYSDLHATRFRFFQSLLADRGARWSVVEPMRNDLNAGETYYVGTATYECSDLAALDAALEHIGSRIVFLIDWNRARKRLQQFVSKQDAQAILAEAARRDVGHMGWLRAGGPEVVYQAMQDAGDGAFRIGDRLCDVLGDASAREFVLEVLATASLDQQRGRPVSLTAEATRLMLLRRVRDRTSEFDLVAEHAAYCHELACALRDALASEDASAVESLAGRAKAWERAADALVAKALDAAEVHPRRKPVAGLLVVADDIADELEEAMFLLTLLVARPQSAFPGSKVRESIRNLSETVVRAVQDYVRALAIARGVRQEGELDEPRALLDALWRIDLAEQRCDDQLRAVRRAMLDELETAADLQLAGGVASAIELASDRLLATTYAVRELALPREALA